MRSRHSAPPVVLALALAAGIGRAEEPEDHWEQGDPRPFLAAEVDLGNAEHVSVAAGYGKPHLVWGGLIAHGFATLDFAAARFGARIDLQALALEGGLRVARSWKHLPLPDVALHTEIPRGDGFTSRTLDLSASGGLPLGPGFAIYEVVGVRSLSDLGDVQLYDELLRVVYRPPWLVAASAGWVASLRGGALLAGGRAQWAFRTGRSGDPFVRLGPVVFWRLWPHLALAGELLYPVSNPDRMAFADPIEAFVVLSFTAATGDRPPRFP
jgi:hypothetical protein